MTILSHDAGRRFLWSKAGAFAIAFVGVFGGVFSPAAEALTCQHIRQLTNVYFKMHFSFNEFNDELSRRTLDNFVKAWDPGKVYFLQADVDRFTEQYGTKVDDMINQADCKIIDDIVNTYSKRFDERQKTIQSIIETKHDFTVEEYLEFDRKKMPWAKTTEELNDRWRKRVKFQLLQLKETGMELDKARVKVTKRFQLGAKRQAETTTDDVYAMFLSSFSTALDPHSEYMSPESLEDFRINTRLSLEGIGAVLRSEDGFTTIQSLVPGGAAAQTGLLKVNDKIIAVAQGKDAPVDVIDMDLREVVKMIRGTRATEVRLTIVREDKDKNTQLIVPVIREKIQLTDRAAKSRIHRAEVKEAKETAAKRQLKIGVIHLPSFYMDFEGRQKSEANYTSSSADMRREINKLKAQNVDGIIVDLRSNGGGSLDEAINVGGLFTGKGPEVQIRGQDGAASVSSYRDGPAIYDGPLLVMINRQSASASEIFAGAIQDYNRGLIVGDHNTFGKGTVQNLTDIDEKLGAVKVTISKFYRPSGASTQLRGVESDIVLPDIMDEYEIGEKHYDYALPWEKIKDAEFKPFSLVSTHVPKLRLASNARLAKDPGFKKILEDIKTYKDTEVERSRVSLKEKNEKDKKDAKKDAKTADKKAKESGKDPKDNESEDDEQEMPIEHDFGMQEALRIAADYVQSLNGRELSEVTLPDVPVYKPDQKIVSTDAKGSTAVKKDTKKHDTEPLTTLVDPDRSTVGEHAKETKTPK